MRKVGYIPARILPKLGPSAQQVSYGQETLGSLINSRKVEVSEAGDFHLVLVSDRVRVKIKELARGDFNGDTFEDAIVSVHAKATGGTMRSAPRFVLLTQVASADQTYQIVRMK